jgi:hypothetical protein
VAQVGLQGVVRPKNLQASAAPLVYVAQALGGSDWATVMALSIALSVIATTGAGIVLSERRSTRPFRQILCGRCWEREGRRKFG